MRGKKIAITRSSDDAGEFLELAAREAAEPITLSTIKLVSRDNDIVGEFLGAVRDENPDYTVFMSSKAVALLFDTAAGTPLLDELRMAVANTSVVAVGPKTRDALMHYGVRTAHMPERYSSVGVGEVMSSLGAAGKRVLVPRSGASTPFLKELLAKMGIIVREIHLYDVEAAPASPEWHDFARLLAGSRIDGIIFTSVSSVRAFFEIMGGLSGTKGIRETLDDTRIVAIGPFTADCLDEFGVQNIVAQVHTVSGAFDALRDSFA